MDTDVTAWRNKVLKRLRLLDENACGIFMVPEVRTGVGNSLFGTLVPR
jgi:hypothetical protein